MGLAQNSLTRLRLVHQSTPLPEGTVFVVLQRMSTEKVGDNWQPEFIAGDDFPVTSIEPIQVDTLADDRQSRATYLRTSATGHLYFLYALTPAEDLYWSYSYERGQPKFDALEFGAMSVAPLADAAIADVVRTRFFSDEPVDATTAADALEAAPLPPVSGPTAPAAEEATADLPAASTPYDGTTPWWLWLLWVLLCVTAAGLFYQQRRIGVLVNELQRLRAAEPLPAVKGKPRPAAPQAVPSPPPSEPPTPRAQPSINDAPVLAASKAAADHADETLEATSQTLHDQAAFAKSMRSEALSDFEAMRRNLEAIDQLADDLKRSSGSADQR